MADHQRTPWQAADGFEFAGGGLFGRGNVGIGTEGAFGRFKPDVVAPGTFVVSTRSRAMGHERLFYNPTNDYVTDLSTSLWSSLISVCQHIPRSCPQQRRAV